MAHTSDGQQVRCTIERQNGSPRPPSASNGAVPRASTGGTSAVGPSFAQRLYASTSSVGSQVSIASPTSLTSGPSPSPPNTSQGIPSLPPRSSPVESSPRILTTVAANPSISPSAASFYKAGIFPQNVQPQNSRVRGPRVASGSYSARPSSSHGGGSPVASPSPAPESSSQSVQFYDIPPPPPILQAPAHHRSATFPAGNLQSAPLYASRPSFPQPRSPTVPYQQTQPLSAPPTLYSPPTANVPQVPVQQSPTQQRSGPSTGQRGLFKNVTGLLAGASAGIVGAAVLNNVMGDGGDGLSGIIGGVANMFSSNDGSGSSGPVDQFTGFGDGGDTSSDLVDSLTQGLGGSGSGDYSTAGFATQDTSSYSGGDGFYGPNTYDTGYVDQTNYQVTDTISYGYDTPAFGDPTDPGMAYYQETYTYTEQDDYYADQTQTQTQTQQPSQSQNQSQSSSSGIGSMLGDAFKLLHRYQQTHNAQQSQESYTQLMHQQQVIAQMQAQQNQASMQQLAAQAQLQAQTQAQAQAQAQAQTQAQLQQMVSQSQMQAQAQVQSMAQAQAQAQAQLQAQIEALQAQNQALIQAQQTQAQALSQQIQTSIQQTQDQNQHGHTMPQTNHTQPHSQTQFQPEQHQHQLPSQTTQSHTGANTPTPPPIYPEYQFTAGDAYEPGPDHVHSLSPDQMEGPSPPMYDSVTPNGSQAHPSPHPVDSPSVQSDGRTPDPHASGSSVGTQPSHMAQTYEAGQGQSQVHPLGHAGEPHSGHSTAHPGHAEHGQHTNSTGHPQASTGHNHHHHQASSVPNNHPHSVPPLTGNASHENGMEPPSAGHHYVSSSYPVSPVPQTPGHIPSLPGNAHTTAQHTSSGTHHGAHVHTGLKPHSPVTHTGIHKPPSHTSTVPSASVPLSQQQPGTHNSGNSPAAFTHHQIQGISPGADHHHQSVQSNGPQHHTTGASTLGLHLPPVTQHQHVQSPGSSHSHIGSGHTAHASHHSPNMHPHRHNSVPLPNTHPPMANKAQFTRQPYLQLTPYPINLPAFYRNPTYIPPVSSPPSQPPQHPPLAVPIGTNHAQYHAQPVPPAAHQKWNSTSGLAQVGKHVKDGLAVAGLATKIYNALGTNNSN